jgi:hypothetical protein
LDKIFSKHAWSVHPNIIPFLTNMTVTDKNLHPYVAPVDHNFLNEAKALHFAHTTLGYFCHCDKDKELHMEHMDNDACVVVGFNNMVRRYQHLVLLHDPTISLTNHKHHKGIDMDSKDNKVYMKRLNPHSVDREKGMSLFPPSNKFYDLIQGKKFKQFLSINGTTKDGQHAFAQHYNVLDK